MTSRLDRLSANRSGFLQRISLLLDFVDRRGGGDKGCCEEIKTVCELMIELDDRLLEWRGGRDDDDDPAIEQPTSPSPDFLLEEELSAMSAVSSTATTISSSSSSSSAADVSCANSSRSRRRATPSQPTDVELRENPEMLNAIYLDVTYVLQHLQEQDQRRLRQLEDNGNNSKQIAICKRLSYGRKRRVVIFNEFQRRICDAIVVRLRDAPALNQVKRKDPLVPCDQVKDLMLAYSKLRRDISWLNTLCCVTFNDWIRFRQDLAGSPNDPDHLIGCLDRLGRACRKRTRIRGSRSVLDTPPAPQPLKPLQLPTATTAAPAAKRRRVVDKDPIKKRIACQLKYFARVDEEIALATRDDDDGTGGMFRHFDDQISEIRRKLLLKDPFYTDDVSSLCHLLAERYLHEDLRTPLHKFWLERASVTVDGRRVRLPGIGQRYIVERFTQLICQHLKISNYPTVEADDGFGEVTRKLEELRQRKAIVAGEDVISVTAPPKSEVIENDDTMDSTSTDDSMRISYRPASSRSLTPPAGNSKSVDYPVGNNSGACGGGGGNYDDEEDDDDFDILTDF